jgi:Fe-S-cluster containining protein
VDAVIKSNKGIIPIDSKFPIENFRKYHAEKNKEQRKIFKREFLRDSRKHIEDIAKKYIKPEEETVDFALMYIPSEAIYYDLAIQDDDFVSFAEEKKVLIVSPNSFYYFLRIILMGLEGKKIEEKAQGNKEEMKKLIEQIKTDPKNAAKILSGIKIDRWVCSIHKNRPIICRLYPCGRFQQIEKKTGEREEMFMLQTDQKGFCPGFEEKETTTLKDYLSSQKFGEHQEGSNLFSKILNLLTSNGFYAMTEENKNSDIKPLFSPNSHVIVFLGNLIYNFDSFNTFSEDPRVIKTIYDENSTQDDFLYVENKIFDVVKGFVELMQKKPSMNDFESFIKTLSNKT